MAIKLGEVLFAGKNDIIQSLAIDINPNEAFYTDITTQNSTNSEPVKDFASVFGTYNSGTDEFIPDWGYVKEDVSIDIGPKTTTVNCQGQGSGYYDCLAGYGDYSGGQFTFEEMSLLLDAINVVTGGQIEITGVDIYK